MSLMQWVLLVFIALEAMNVLTLYFSPASTKGNGVGVFSAYQQRLQNTASAELIDYLVNWVAGAKLIFIGLLLLIVFWGDDFMHRAALVVLLLTTLSFYWRLFPKIRAIDKKGLLTLSGYSNVLGWMILTFCACFAVAAFLGR